MHAVDRFSSLVAVLYEAAADPQHWSRFVAEFYSAMDSTRGVLCARAPEAAKTNVHLEGYSESEKRNYAEYYFQFDEVLAAGLQSVANQSHWTGSLEEIYSYKRMEASEIYNDYYRDLDMHYASCAMVGATGPYTALGLAAWRSKKDGPFSPEQHHLVELLTPHLKRAFYLQSTLAALDMEACALRAALEATAAAVFALRADGHILAASAGAEAVLTRNDLLMRFGGRLVAMDAGRNATLQELINTAARVSGIELTGAGGSSIQPGGAMLMPGPGDQHPLQIQVLPARVNSWDLNAGPAVLVFLADPGASLPSRSQLLRELYHLTPLESRLADLFLEGKELKHAADHLKLTYENTRFHLKQIFRKTKTTRQTDLLRFCSRFPPAVDSAHARTGRQSRHRMFRATHRLGPLHVC